MNVRFPMGSSTMIPIGIFPIGFNPTNQMTNIGKFPIRFIPTQILCNSFESNEPKCLEQRNRNLKPQRPTHVKEIRFHSWKTPESNTHVQMRT